MKYLIRFKNWIIFSVLGVGIVLAAGQVIPDQIDDKINVEVLKLETIIKSDLQSNGKYKRQDKQVIDNIEYEVHEYETSKGGLGYQIFIRNDNFIKSIATGIEAEQRTFEIFTIATTTL